MICALLCAAALAPAPADGQLVAVSGSRLVTLDARGASGVRTLWQGHAPSAPAWSPDGNAVALADAGRIVVVEPASGQAKTLADGGAPAWSPDGAELAFARGGSVLAMRRDGGGVRRLLELDAPVDGLAWGGDRLAVVSGGTLLVVPLAQGELELRVPVGVSGMPAWSGDKLAYTRAGRVRIDPSGWSAAGAEPAWAPDGTRLVFARGSGLRVLEGGAVRAVPAQAGAPLAEPDWQPCIAGVTADCASPAAPVLSPRAVPRLGRGGAVLSARCDRACRVSLRLRITLDGGRTVEGRAVGVAAAAGEPLRLRLACAKVPAGRRIAGARISGTVSGAGATSRSFTLKLR